MATPHYPTVPDSWKHPMGDYRQAPPEYGGEWWFVNPFHGEEPWERAAQPVASEVSFEAEAVFGERPVRADHPELSAPQFIALVNSWKAKVEHFGGVVVHPDGFPPEYVSEVSELLARYGFENPVFYQDRNGVRVRFPAFRFDFDPGAVFVLYYTGQFLAGAQRKLIGEGHHFQRLAPMLPPRYAELNEANKGK